MGVEFLIGFLVVLLVLSLLAEPLSRRLHFPHSSVLVVLGAATVHIATLGFGIDTGLRAQNFHDLVMFGLLPVLVFEAAFKVPCRALLADFGIILLLATAGTLLTTVICGALLYVGIGHPSGFPWVAALLAGALLAATDPVAVVQQLKTLGAPERLEVLLEGESLFNDATAIVIFTVLLGLASSGAGSVALPAATFDFLVKFCGGALVGALTGAVAVAAARSLGDGVATVAITVATAYGSFLIAESALHLSGVMGSLGAGLVMSYALARPGHRTEQIDFLWSAIAYIANGTVFLLMGATITLAMFTERWLAMVIAIIAVLLARAASTFGSLGVANLASRRPLPLRQQTVIVWGGLRGAVTLALALALPTDLPYWWTIQSMAFGVVLFTLFVQATSMPWLLRRTGLSSVQ